MLGAGDPVGSSLAASDRVDKIAFTGGTATGRKIMIAAAGNLKKISLELGGKNPNVVFADADPRRGARICHVCRLRRAGEVCSAGSRLLLDRKLAGCFSAPDRGRGQDCRR